MAKAKSKDTRHNVWDADQYWAKGVRYFVRMHEASQGSADAAFNAALSIELFARAALSGIHPALNADPRDEGDHILFAFGYPSKVQPKSIPIHSVYTRLTRVYAGRFTEDMKRQAEYISHRRNEELHGASLPFETIKEEEWLPGYYGLVFAIAKLLGRKQQDLFANPADAKAARAMVKKAREKRHSVVMKKVGLAKHAFASLPGPDQATRTQASAQAARMADPSRVATCPACKSTILLRGSATSIGQPKFNGDLLVAEVRFATTGAACSACQLKLSGATEIGIAKLPPRYSEDHEYDLHRDRDDDEEQEYDNM